MQSLETTVLPGAPVGLCVRTMQSLMGFVVDN